MTVRSYFSAATAGLFAFLTLWGGRRGGPSVDLLYTTEVQGYVDPCG